MMNCQWFQDKLFEYLDGELSASVKSEVESHLEQCATCLKAVQTHHALSARFRHDTDSLLLRSETSWRIEAALQRMEALPFWRRVAWPAAITAALLVAAGLSFRRPIRLGVQSSEATLITAPATISIRFSSCDPTYTFRLEKNRVIDALTCTPRVVQENLSLSLNQNQLPQTQERKTPL